MATFVRQQSCLDFNATAFCFRHYLCEGVAKIIVFIPARTRIHVCRHQIPYRMLLAFKRSAGNDILATILAIKKAWMGKKQT